MLTTLPSSNSFVSSPRYQTLPHVSWAYQSNVSSITWSPSVTMSCTTVAGMPRIVFVRSVTVTSTRCSAPSLSVSR